MIKATEKTADQWRAEAQKQEDARRESFDRCDTDGFLSQWASGITAQVYEMKAQIAENGGQWTFPGLYEKETGKRLPATLTSRPKFNAAWIMESVWCIEDPATGRAVEWVAAFKKGTRSNLFKRGYEERDEVAPADAKVFGRGRGLSGSAWAAIYRTDGGYPGRSNNFAER
jgi:hypothetical protein